MTGPNQRERLSPSKPFTYWWGIRGSTSILAPRRNGYVLLVIGAALLLWFLARWNSNPMHWLFAITGSGTVAGGVGLLMQPRLDTDGDHRNRFVRIHFDREVIEFCHVPFSQGFLRTKIEPHYECPIAELNAFEFSSVSSDASLHLWTPRGKVSITTDSGRIALRALADHIRSTSGGPRPPMFFARTWVRAILMGLIAFALSWLLLQIVP